MPHYIDECRVVNPIAQANRKLEHRLANARFRAQAGVKTIWVAQGLDQPFPAGARTDAPLTETQQEVFQQMKDWLESPAKTRPFHFKHN